MSYLQQSTHAVLFESSTKIVLCHAWLCRLCYWWHRGWCWCWGSVDWLKVTASITTVDIPIRTPITVKDHKAILWYCSEQINDHSDNFDTWCKRVTARLGALATNSQTTLKPCLCCCSYTVAYYMAKGL